ncbi:pentapeptide repeat-containing protein [Paenibacillus paridis]|uniref:pentapeptide repeat-containing protein n=1 Tax=Paenibacillus paridis TaxID=2583376 RepID=UPI0011209205|nr:pentapeptide repeat-containing protein [Paenibacillus paridis]
MSIHVESFHNKSESLKADCENCFGLCCAALPFAASADFAINKDAGQPCSNLQANFRCGVHMNLRQLGFKGCTVYDCFGAGQKVSQFTYKGQDWRRVPESAAPMFEVFRIMKQLQELLWYLSEALAMPETQSIHSELQLALEETEHLTNLDPESFMKVDIVKHRADVNVLLLQTSEFVRTEAQRKQKPSKGKGRQRSFGRGADLIGAKLKGSDLRSSNLRGAYLIAADLRGADLRAADLIGADFRDADLSGADLSESIFLTQAQLNSAKGDDQTKLPTYLARPTHWATEDSRQ